jgi:cell division protein FtsB
MRAFERRQNGVHIILRFFIRSAVALALLGVVVVSVRAAWGMYHRFAAAAEGARSAQAELEDTRERQKEIASAVAEFSSTRGVEATVRERYGLGKPGEGKIEIVRESSGEETLEVREEGNVFMRILRSLFVW